MHLTRTGSRAMRGLVAGAGVLVTCLAAPQLACADPKLVLRTHDGSNGAGSITVQGQTVGAVRLTVRRRGELIVDQTGSEPALDRVEVPVAPRPGDVMRFYTLTGTRPFLRTTWAGYPTLVECRVGASRVAARVLAPSYLPGSTDEAMTGVHDELATVTEIAPGQLELGFANPLTPADRVMLTSSRFYNSYELEATVERRAGECGRPAVVPAPEPFDARASLRGGPLDSVFNPVLNPRYAFINSVVGCPPESRVACKGYLRIETLDATPIRLAQEQVSVPAGELQPVSLATSDALPGAFGTARTLDVREVVTTWNQRGRPVVSDRITTLRRVDLPYPTTDPG